MIVFIMAWLVQLQKYREGYNNTPSFIPVPVDGDGKILKWFSLLSWKLSVVYDI